VCQEKVAAVKGCEPSNIVVVKKTGPTKTNVNSSGCAIVAADKEAKVERRSGRKNAISDSQLAFRDRFREPVSKPNFLLKRRWHARLQRAPIKGKGTEVQLTY